jgi:hypothetical protein
MTITGWRSRATQTPPLVGVESVQASRAVEGMESGHGQAGHVPNVMQPRGGDQEAPVLGGCGAGDPVGLRGDRLDVRPTVAERREQALGLAVPNRPASWLLCRQGTSLPVRSTTVHGPTHCGLYTNPGGWSTWASGPGPSQVLLGSV